MSRLMSVTFTEDAVRDRTKTVTRRAGWLTLTPGQHLTLCRKVMGRRRRDGTVEPLVRLAEVEVVDVCREPLSALTADPEYGASETTREGFPPGDPAHDPAEFIDRYFVRAQRLTPETVVTRIEWRYLP